MQKPAPPQKLPIPHTENTIKIIALLSMLLGCFYAMDSLAKMHNISTLIPLFLLALFASMLMLGMAILAHDGTHRVLFNSVIVNDLVSGFLSAVGGGVPFYANRQFHLAHHTSSHQGEDDPEYQMHDRPFWQALLLGAFIGLYLQYKILLKNLIDSRQNHKFRIRAFKDIGFLSLAVLFFSMALWALELSPIYTVLPAFLMFPLTFTFRAMSDHYGLPKVERKASPDREQQVTGWVVHTPRWLEWLWSHVNYHEVHHKFPYLSHIHLKQAFEATKHSYRYHEVNGYTRSLFALRHSDYYAQFSRSDD